jgi:putative restriction endonuclease
MREEVLVATGLWGLAGDYLQRAPSDFRDAVLIAYEYRCALTGFDLRLGQDTVGLDAAHIKMGAAGGPDEPANGLALTTLHHKLFDRGAFTLRPDLTVVVSEHANGAALDQALLQYHGRRIRPPQRAHERELFQGRPRPL